MRVLLVIRFTNTEVIADLLKRYLKSSSVQGKNLNFCKNGDMLKNRNYNDLFFYHQNSALF